MAEATSGTYAPFADDASFDMDDDEVEYTRGPFLFVVALVVLAAFAGVVYAAYQQGLRQGQSETLPTAVAQPGPIRVRPDNPGGLNEPYQDKFVLNGEAAVNMKAIVNQPEEPVDIPLPAAESVTPAVDETSAAPAAVEAAGPTIEDLVEESLIVDATPPGAEEIADAPVVDATPKVIADEEVAAVPAEEAVPEEPLAIARVAEEGVALEDTPTPVVEDILPAPAEEVAAITPQMEVPAPPPIEGAGIDVNSGSYVVQVASVKDNQSLARSKADEIGVKYASVITGGIATGLQRADLDKGIYYRVRVGPFSEKAEANAVCSSLKGQGQDCFVTQP